MMERLFAFVLVLTSLNTYSQQSPRIINESRNLITMTGMKVLGSWGIVNLGVGAAGWATAHNDRNKYFYQMSTLWGVVNTGLAVVAHNSARRNMNDRLSQSENLKAQRVIENTFLINGAFDFVYIGAGLYTNIRGNTRDNAKLQGYGTSVIMQGVFLLVFDAAMYSVQKTNGNRIRRIFEKNAVSFTGNSVGIVRMF